jgi:hypothetical protein
MAWNWKDYALTGATGGLYGAGKLAADKYGKDVMDWMGKKNAPQIPQNPYLNDWGSLIGQLQRTASGTGPSVAGGAYQQAHAQGLQDQRSMAAGGSAGAARQAGLNVNQMNAGLAQGYSNARLQEQLAAQQALGGTLAQAGNAWFQPQQANLQAQLGTQTQGQQLMNFLQQLLMAGGTIATKKPAG